MADAVVKIVPMPGTQGPQGPQGPIGPSGGPVGPQGPAGAGYDTFLGQSGIIPGPSAPTVGCDTLSPVWVNGQRVRAIAVSDPTKLVEGYIDQLAANRQSFTLVVDYSEGTWVGGTISEWNFSLTGVRGENGAEGIIESATPPSNTNTLWLDTSVQGLSGIGEQGPVGPQGIAGPAGPVGAKGPAGADGEGFNFKGPWVSGTSYLKNDVVTQNGSTYIANYDYQDTSGPSLDGDLWAPLALKGEPGTPGEGGSSTPQTWTASNDIQYGIYQAHGGIEVTTDAFGSIVSSATVYGNQNNSTSFPLIIQDQNTHDILTAINDGSLHARRISIEVNGIQRNLTVSYNSGAGPNGWTWYFNSLYPITLSDMAVHYFDIVYGSPPVVWWDAANLGFDIANNDFRGAKIDYHAFVGDSGTMIGTIYIASDSGDTHVTHIETGSGGTDLGTAELWYRKNGWQEEERRLYLYRTDGEAQTHKIHWTAQVYYASEFWD